MALRRGKRNTSGQLGFSMVELMVAVAISGIILVGSMMILSHLVVVSSEGAERTASRLQVQYVGFWINQDAVQARDIYLGNSTVEGFPLTMEWTGVDGGNNSVIYAYDTENDTIQRTHYVNDESTGTSVISRYLVPDTTFCYRGIENDETSPDHGEFLDELVLEVTARVDQSEASTTYKISPRGSVTWG